MNTATSTNALVMHPDGRTTNITPANGTHYTLEELQTLVGGYIELVPMPHNRYAVVNEEGQYLNLDFNPRASELLRCAILGPCVIVPRSTMN
jgi:hypothetical protein